MIRQVLGHRIRQLRLERNYSQEAVAADLGVSPKTLSAWELGARAISIEVLATIARYYSLELATLVEGLERLEVVRRNGQQPIQ